MTVSQLMGKLVKCTESSLTQNDKYSVYIKSVDHHYHTARDGGNDGFMGMGLRIVRIWE